MIAIREARDTDTQGIIAIYLATYGEEYAYPQYYDEYEIKKLIFSDETLMLVVSSGDWPCIRIIAVAASGPSCSPGELKRSETGCTWV
jgi:hypothetical protein